MQRNPFSAGRWVRGEHFFGREDLIHKLLNAGESCDWVIGCRRIGKTSLLRQFEHLVNHNPDDERLGLYWDIQGSYDAQGLFDSLYDAIEDGQVQFRDKWGDLADAEWDENGTAPQLLKRLARALQGQNQHLLLLIDEAEELISVGKDNPAMLSKLRRFFQNSHNVHTIITSTPRLEQLYQMMDTETSPFLHGFHVSFLGNLERACCHKMLQRGFEDEDLRERIFGMTYGNPFEAQLLSKHLFENQNLEDVLIQIETNPMLNQTIEVNFNLLSEDEKHTVLATRSGDMNPAIESESERAITAKLLRMGYLKKDEKDNYRIGSRFQARFHGVSHQAMAQPRENTSVISLESAPVGMILKHLPDMYRILLEIIQGGERLAGSSDLTVSEQGMSLSNQPLKEKDTRDQKPWRCAIADTSDLLASLVPKDHGWSVHRFHEMRQNGLNDFQEKDFLDIMLLIAEEASLDD